MPGVLQPVCLFDGLANFNAYPGWIAHGERYLHGHIHFDSHGDPHAYVYLDADADSNCDSDHRAGANRHAIAICVWRDY